MSTYSAPSLPALATRPPLDSSPKILRGVPSRSGLVDAGEHRRAVRPGRMGGQWGPHGPGLGEIVSMEPEADSLWVKQKMVIPMKRVGQKVNLEVDILGKYVERLLISVFVDLMKTSRS
ncbi:hypothetical protein NL676_016454 [Syzygium grande]|nr:hypothetical protein NL676_016454 [Syzygium grande]